VLGKDVFRGGEVGDRAREGVERMKDEVDGPSALVLEGWEVAVALDVDRAAPALAIGVAKIAAFAGVRCLFAGQYFAWFVAHKALRYREDRRLYQPNQGMIEFGGGRQG
jgi:hypothetical protein